MSMRDSYNNISVVSAIDPAVLAADNTPGAIDLIGFDSVSIVLSVGVGGITFSGTNKVEFVLTHSDDNVTYTNVVDLDVQGATGTVTNGIIRSLTAAHPAADAVRFGYRGGKRYLKLLADFSGTHGVGTGISAVVVKGRAAYAPTT